MQYTRREQDLIRDAYRALLAIAQETDLNGWFYVEDAIRMERKATGSVYVARALVVRSAATGAHDEIRGAYQPLAGLYGVRNGLVLAQIAGAGLAWKNRDRMSRWLREHAEPANNTHRDAGRRRMDRPHNPALAGAS